MPAAALAFGLEGDPGTAFGLGLLAEATLGLLVCGDQGSGLLDESVRLRAVASGWHRTSVSVLP